MSVDYSVVLIGRTEKWPVYEIFDGNRPIRELPRFADLVGLEMSPEQAKRFLAIQQTWVALQKQLKDLYEEAKDDATE